MTKLYWCCKPFNSPASCVELHNSQGLNRLSVPLTKWWTLFWSFTLLWHLQFSINNWSPSFRVVSLIETFGRYRKFRDVCDFNFAWITLVQMWDFHASIRKTQKWSWPEYYSSQNHDTSWDRLDPAITCDHSLRSGCLMGEVLAKARQG